MAPIPTLKLNNGIHIPSIGLGTWQGEKVERDNTIKALKASIDAGYRHLDTAACYNTEEEVGQAIQEKIKEGIVKREDIFITTKLWNSFHDRSVIVRECKKSLEKLGLGYIDLYLVHWPMAFEESDGYDYLGEIHPAKGTNHLDTWKGMEECVKLGLVKSIGLSNFNIKQIQNILDHCEIKPVMNQIEIHPYLTQEKLVDFCLSNDIRVTGYANLSSVNRSWKVDSDPDLLTNPMLVELAKKYNKIVPQVVLRWVIQRKIIPIPKSSNPQRQKDNLDVFDFELTPEEVKKITEMNLNHRYFGFPEMFSVHPDYPWK